VADADIVSDRQNKLQSSLAAVTPSGVLAEIHRRKSSDKKQ
jgi:hypothetical protein